MKPPRRFRRLSTRKPTISGGSDRGETELQFDKSAVSSDMQIIVADDHPLFLDALARVMSLEPDVQVVSSCRDGVEVLEAVTQHRADLLLLDIRMPRKDGLTVLRELKEAGRDIPVVVLTAYLADEEVMAILRLGVRGLVLKETAPDMLVRCLREVHAGGRWFEPACLARVADALLRREAGAGEASKALTPREVEIVRKVATGLRNKAIAHQLCVSEGTIKIHLHNIYEKLELNGRFALMHWARVRNVYDDQASCAGPTIPEDRPAYT